MDKESGIKIFLENGIDKSFIRQQEEEFKQFYKDNNNCIFLDDIDCKLRRVIFK